MRKDTFKKYMDSNSKYITCHHLEQMTLEQRKEFRKTHDPWVIWTNSNSDECYTKLNELLDENNNIDYKQMW